MPTKNITELPRNGTLYRFDTVGLNEIISAKASDFLKGDDYMLQKEEVERRAKELNCQYKITFGTGMNENLNPTAFDEQLPVDAIEFMFFRPSRR